MKISKSLPDITLGLCCLGVIVESVLMLSLLLESVFHLGGKSWLMWHVLAGLLIALGVTCNMPQLRDKLRITSYRPVTGSGPGAQIIRQLLPRREQHVTVLPVFYLSFLLSLSIPLLGGLGAALALVLGARYAQIRHSDPVYWQFTVNAELPFTAPIGRKASAIDSRGMTEQLVFSGDNKSLYQKVLSAGRIRTSLSTDILKTAVRHADERIRLTAYQTLDKKTSHLNLAIQRLEKLAATREGQDQSNTWLQIASYYWELLTLEKDEPVARRQLLDKAAEAALNAIKIVPHNRNAHFTYGRVLLLQKNPKRATVAFSQAIAHGMPREKVLPYLAEAAFDQRELHKVAKFLDSIDTAFKAYPPLSHIARYWT